MNVRPFTDFHDANMARERYLDSLDARTKARVSFHPDDDKAPVRAFITPRGDGAYLLTTNRS